MIRSIGIEQRLTTTKHLPLLPLISRHVQHIHLVTRTENHTLITGTKNRWHLIQRITFNHQRLTQKRFYPVGRNARYRLRRE